MADIAKAKSVAAEGGSNLKIRIALASRFVKPLEKVCSNLKHSAKDKGLPVKGPVRLPTKTLRITTRKSPCGEGTNTWDRYEMRIHKRILDVTCPQDLVAKITNVTIEPGVTIEVFIISE
ncbi:RPS20 [Symbiodinium sp. KB8]|nr:RPS20 [Symbiodinium sp. KB8]